MLLGMGCQGEQGAEPLVEQGAEPLAEQGAEPLAETGPEVWGQAVVWKASQSSEKKSMEYEDDASDRQEIAEAMIEMIEAEGYEVRPGLVSFYSIDDCVDYDFCTTINPTSPYGIFGLPYVPGEVPPPIDIRIKGWPEVHPVWRLKPGEAVIFLGKTPPSARYFSFRSYLAARPRRVGNGARLTWASLGDTINPASIGVKDKNDYDDAFNRETVVITTADRNMDRRLREILETLGVLPEEINTDAIKADYKNGVLEIDLPMKNPEQRKVKKVEIS